MGTAKPRTRRRRRRPPRRRAAAAPRDVQRPPPARQAGPRGRAASFPQTPTLVADVVSDMPTAETADAPSQGSWPDDEVSDRSSAPGFTPVSRPGDTGKSVPPRRTRLGGRPATHSDVGKFVSAAPKRPPDSAGDISVITPMRLFCDLALAGETGLLHFELGGTVKEIFLVGGSPESVSSSNANERFGEYLVGKRVLGQADLDLALSMLPHYNGKLGDTLVALGLLRPLDVFRLLSEQVRDRVIDVFAWTEGTFAYYRGVTNRQENFPLGLDTFEILGGSVVNLPYELLTHRFDPLLDYRPVATRRGRVEPEAFRIGPTPREVLNLLDGDRTLRDWMNQFGDREELLTFLRSLYLLVETDWPSSTDPADLQHLVADHDPADGHHDGDHHAEDPDQRRQRNARALAAAGWCDRCGSRLSRAATGSALPVVVKWSRRVPTESSVFRRRDARPARRAVAGSPDRPWASRPGNDPARSQTPPRFRSASRDRVPARAPRSRPARPGRRRGAATARRSGASGRCAASRRRRAGEQALPGDHLPQHDAQREDVGAVIDRRAAHLLRRQVSELARQPRPPCRPSAAARRAPPPSRCRSRESSRRPSSAA